MHPEPRKFLIANVGCPAERKELLMNCSKALGLIALACCAPALLSVGCGGNRKPDPTPVDWVNPYIGTAGGGSDYGGMMPLVTAPFGMTNWTPQSRQNLISVNSYAWEDRTISGFIGTHQPAIWMGDFGYVTLTPELDDIKVTPESRKLPFARAQEIATPYYYSVVLDAGNSRTIRAEMTATERCGMLRFTFPRSSRASVVVEATRPGIAGLAAVDARTQEITGFNPHRMDAHLGPFALPNFKGYFVIQFRRPFGQFGTYRGTDLQPGNARVEDKNAGAWASFETQKGEVLEVRVGTSFISIEQARENLKSEVSGWDFDAVRARLKDTWNRKLGIASIEGATDDQRKIFYTGIYHALLYPRIFSEQGRYYSAFDDTIHQGDSYTAFSLWDTFRAEHALLTLFAPERVDGMVTALLQNYREGGWMPKWPNPSYTNIMIGTHADSVLAEAIAKGFRGFDQKLAYDAVHKDAMVPPDGDTKRRWLDREEHTPYEARGGLTYLQKLGYIPDDKTAESASRTLEDAYDDWCAAQVARAAGKEDEYRFLLKRNRRLYGVAYTLDNVGDIYLVGRMALHSVTADEIDRILGQVLEAVDADFNTLLELGFKSSIQREWEWRVSRGESLKNLRAFEHLIDDD